MDSVYRKSKQICHSSSGGSSFQRSISPSGRFCSSSISSSSSAFASSISGLSSNSSGGFFTRSASPTRVNFGSSQTSQSIRFSIDRSTSPGRSIAVANKPKQKVSSQKKTCMCSPTTHPGSFRCSLHKNGNNRQSSQNQPTTYHSNRLYARRSAMTNSLVRIGTVEGDLVRRALAALIRPSSHQQRRRADFQPRPSRLSIMSKAEDD
ncbi:uncharacterized protein LOC124930987 [Impatiens glandulifera]|uniref:uncharacterized protein LOC124930987 n=1 Tax=Impatiens glandulifera TaxID=253017 RepID=UPI001FB0E577|nr:uncharacterized protein LOC124930987 [Impatiens glandulifera]